MTTATKKKKPIRIVNHMANLSRQVSNEYGLDRDVANHIVQDIFNNMKDILLAEGEVSVKNFGKLRLRHQKNMRYFHFHEKVMKVIDRNVAVFYPAASLKDLINCVDLPADGGRPIPRRTSPRL